MKGLGFRQPLTEMSTRNRKIYFWGAESGQCVRFTTSPSCVSLLPRKCGTLNISQLCRSPRPVIGIALLFIGVQSYNTYFRRCCIRIPKQYWAKMADKGGMRDSNKPFRYFQFFQQVFCKDCSESWRWTLAEKWQIEQRNQRSAKSSTLINIKMLFGKQRCK
jgi:hypothetical protein